MLVHRFNRLPRSIAGFQKALRVPGYGGIPRTPLEKPIEEARAVVAFLRARRPCL